RPAPVAAALPSARDLDRAAHARQAFQDDVELGPLHEQGTFQVRIIDGVAELTGLVPSADLSERAARCVKRVKGVVRVDNRLKVAEPQPAPFVVPLAPEPPSTSRSALAEREPVPPPPP